MIRPDKLPSFILHCSQFVKIIASVYNILQAAGLNWHTPASYSQIHLRMSFLTPCHTNRLVDLHLYYLLATLAS